MQQFLQCSGQESVYLWEIHRSQDQGGKEDKEITILQETLADQADGAWDGVKSAYGHYSHQWKTLQMDG